MSAAVTRRAVLCWWLAVPVTASDDTLVLAVAAWAAAREIAMPGELYAASRLAARRIQRRLSKSLTPAA